jgi:outer membrane protein OmpA-like peptidoglycan-associated protein
VNVQLLPHTQRPLVATPKSRDRLLWMAGCSALFLTVITAAPSPVFALDPYAEVPKAAAGPAKSGPKKEASKPTSKTDTAKTGAKTGTKAEATKSKAKPDAAKGGGKSDTTSSKSRTDATKAKANTDSGKKKWQCTSDGHGIKGVPPIPAAKAQPKPAVPPGTFEKGPGVLSVSLRGQRQEQIAKYVSEPVGSVALAMDGLRFATVNKGTHAEVNLGDQVSVEGKGDKATLKGHRALDVIARILYDNPQTRATIIVHTEDRGEAADNLRQSQQGAEAIKAYLTTRCVSADRLTAIGRGEEEPLVIGPNQTMTWKERIRNKRVMLLIEPLLPAPVAATPVTGHSQADTQLATGIIQPAPGVGVAR